MDQKYRAIKNMLVFYFVSLLVLDLVWLLLSDGHATRESAAMAVTIGPMVVIGSLACYGIVMAFKEPEYTKQYIIGILLTVLVAFPACFLNGAFVIGSSGW